MSAQPELLACPLCGSANLSEGIVYPHGSSDKEPAVMCCECSCRARKSHWQSRALAQRPPDPWTNAIDPDARTPGDDLGPSELIRIELRQAMIDCWNSICMDTDCHPLDIERQGKSLYFSPNHWADMIAAELAGRLSHHTSMRDPAPASAVPERVAAPLSQWIDRDVLIGGNRYKAGCITISDVIDHAARASDEFYADDEPLSEEDLHMVDRAWEKHKSAISKTPEVKAGLVGCDWPAGKRFAFFDEPGEHDPCYVVMPCGGMLVVNHHAGEGVDIARAKFIIDACNQALPGRVADKDAIRAAVEKHCHIDTRWPSSARIDNLHMDAFVEDLTRALVPQAAPDLAKENAKLREALEEIIKEVGTSTKANKIAIRALAQLPEGRS